jgi:hypothetical protein
MIPCPSAAGQLGGNLVGLTVPVSLPLYVPKSGNEPDQLIKRSKLVTKRRLSAVLDADRYLSPHRYSMMPKSGSRRYSMKAPPRFPAGLIESGAIYGIFAFPSAFSRSLRGTRPT